MMYTNFGWVLTKGGYILQILPPLIIFQLDFFKLLYCRRLLIHMQIFNLIRPLESGENYVEIIHYIEYK